MHAERLSSYELANGFKALELDPILLSTKLNKALVYYTSLVSVVD